MKTSCAEIRRVASIKIGCNNKMTSENSEITSMSGVQVSFVSIVLIL